MAVVQAVDNFILQIDWVYVSPVVSWRTTSLGEMLQTQRLNHQPTEIL